MKKLVVVTIVSLTLGVLIGAVSSNRLGLYNAFLQSNIDGNQMAGTNFASVSLGQLFIATNDLSVWPTAPTFPGQAVFVNSNGVVYLITSGPGLATWAATNKLAP